MKRKILSWLWKQIYGDDCDIVWFDDLVDIETGEQGIKVYHIVDSIKESSRGMDRLGIETVTRVKAESMGIRPCEECFNIILPRSDIYPTILDTLRELITTLKKEILKKDE